MREEFFSAKRYALKIINVVVTTINTRLHWVRFMREHKEKRTSQRNKKHFRNHVVPGCERPCLNQLQF